MVLTKPTWVCTGVYQTRWKITKGAVCWCSADFSMTKSPSFENSFKAVSDYFSIRDSLSSYMKTCWVCWIPHESLRVMILTYFQSAAICSSDRAYLENTLHLCLQSRGIGCSYASHCLPLFSVGEACCASMLTIVRAENQVVRYDLQTSRVSTFKL